MKLLFIALAVVAACTQPPGDKPKPDPDPDPPVETVAAIQFAPGLEAASNEQFAEEFSLLGQRDIVAVITIPAEPGLHFMRFDLVNDRGSIQQSSYKAYSTDTNAPSDVMHPVLGQEIAVEKVTLGDDGFVRVQGFIPVAGTNFTRFRLTGIFTAQVFVGTDFDVEATVESSFLMEL